MKPKYKPGMWVLVKDDDGEDVKEIKGVHVNLYSEQAEEKDGVQYEVWNQDDWIDEDDIECQMVRSSKK